MKNICVIFGGQSSEHEVSRVSVMTVLENMPEDCKAYPVGITREGKWMLYEGDTAKIPTGEWESEQNKSCFFSPSSDYPGLTVFDGGELSNVEIDCVFAVLHGKNGEDGTIQGLFELKGIPYVGCGVLSSAVSMDKSYTKLLVDTLGIRQADYVLVDQFSHGELHTLCRQAESRLGFPMFVKPCNFGSSVGVSRVESPDELRKALSQALKCDSRVLIEEAIVGREVECAVFEDNGELLASGVGEVIAADTFYSYDAKYNNTESRTDISPELPAGKEFEIREASKRIFKLLSCRNLSRVDFFIENETGDIVFNEINTLPGFTPISMYPMLMQKAGLSPKALVAGLIESAMKNEK